MSVFEPARQVPGVFHRRLGDLTVTVLNDGWFDASFDLVTNIGKEEAERLETGAFRRKPPQITVSAFAISGPSGVTLVDSGAGSAMPGLGLVPANMQAAGIAPEVVTRVLVTHMHPDHVGGLVTDAGAARFPHAEIVMHENEAAFWLDPATLDRVPADARVYVEIAQKAGHVYKDRLRTMSTGEAAPGFEIVPEHGHTPGHSGWMVRSGRESLLIWGDIVHLPGIQFAQPEAGVAFDADGAAAVATRKRIFAMAADDGLLVAGIHLDFPTLGHVKRDGSGYRFVPENWAAGF
ncbi:MAG TPA: MBL fold metallo-hydrolase [Acidisphaera sp.]|nr:MBL fold metallo-hydrolase [Acidisphaera sp.]